MDCIICGDQNPCKTLTDGHWVYECYCGVTYQRKPNAEPRCTLREDVIPHLKAYWEEYNRPMSLGFRMENTQEQIDNSNKVYEYLENSGYRPSQDDR